MSSRPSPLIEWGVAQRSLPGQVESGDGYVVEAFPGGILIGVIDGLGHGSEAAEVTRVAAGVLRGHAGETVTTLFQLCHAALLGTRGVVITLASLAPGSLTWLGVGNVEGLLLGGDNELPRRETARVRGGTVGYRLPPLRPAVTPLAEGDTLVFVTDGIQSDYNRGLKLGDAPQKIADDLVARFCKGTDDALALVVRYAGKLL
ncbi:MAG: SpoIIE family protein phosphatase [Chloroflexi bacterium]|nr:SpoIIE family protein phosphatase [Chloroflexota bacterium]